MPFTLSEVCSPSEANYCSNPFKVFHFCTVVFHLQKVASNTLPVFEFSLRGDQLQEEEELGFLARGNNAKSLDAPKVMAEVCDYRGCFGFLLCLGWRVGEHQFSSPNCPRSFQCGEHFPSSPVSQATIASTRKKKSHCKIHIHTRILSYFSSPVLVKRYYYEEKYFQVPCKELELTLKGGTINVTYL